MGIRKSEGDHRPTNGRDTSRKAGKYVDGECWEDKELHDLISFSNMISKSSFKSTEVS